ncbi:cell division inhibitor SulA [Shewanella sp. YIC-542]|uniref:cell division inhibitor SulA n=1 Tax=Shewanella mytili TaxID=3377111 RepID=UPI00398F09FC
MSTLMGKAPEHPGLWQDAAYVAEHSWQQTEITSLVTHSQGRQELQQLSTQLARLSQLGRWIVLINPENAIGYKELLADAGVRMDRVLLVRARDEVEALWAMEKALTSGTSSAVISWVEQLDHKDKRRLQLVAKSARAMGIVLENNPMAAEPASLFPKLQAVH